MIQRTRPYRLFLIRLERLLVDGLFVLLLLGCVIAAGWLTARHDRYWDLSQSQENRLSPESRRILERLDSPLRLTVFADPQSSLARRIGQFLERYLRERPDLSIRYLDPQRFPEQARAAEVELMGQILIEYRGRREALTEISEHALSAAIARLERPRQTWIAVITGHGERAIDGDASQDLKRFGRELEAMGLMARPLDLTKIGAVPDNARLVILTQPQRPLPQVEQMALIAFIERGGSLLWLMDPGEPVGLESLSKHLGLNVLPGSIIDTAARSLGFDVPTAAVIGPGQPLTEEFKGPAILPGALAFGLNTAPHWTLAGVLTTSPESWNELGSLQAPLSQDEVIGERLGPLPVILALSRRLVTGGEQRLVISGDGDFLSNAYFGRPDNRALALVLVRWLAAGEELPELPPPASATEPLILSEGQRALIGIGTLVVLPGLFALGGFGLRWWRVRRS
ncbi:GldG family protein [Caldichromatium japonicum]|uniref:GldG family protein n=1 Tax=Caldichromatium japonicum TaxID=2699430 RepID=A0A6G7VBJ0_9GAMM|nr:GldG family protein [Caldichromatium japonicum]QIK37443.1 GldG family protein [Caldichromatium japonicum]